MRQSRNRCATLSCECESAIKPAQRCAAPAPLCHRCKCEAASGQQPVLQNNPSLTLSGETAQYVELLVELAKLVLTGDREERARLELKAENKGFIPILVSLRMSEVSLHGNDSRQVCYDAYVLIPESGEDSNPFTSSFLLRRKATMKEADWMSPSDYVLTAAQPGAPSSPGNLSLEKQAAHLLAGESVPMALFQALLHTSDSSPKPILTKRSDAVAVFNFCPHDGGLELGCLKANNKGPSSWQVCSLGLDLGSGLPGSCWQGFAA